MALLALGAALVFPAPDLIITSIVEFVDPDSLEKFKCAGPTG